MLIFPNLSAGNIAYKLLNHLGGATAIGPILVGMSRPVHVLERGADVQDIVNMAAVAVVDAQERSYPVEPVARPTNGAHSDDLLEVMTWRLKRRRRTTPVCRATWDWTAQGLDAEGRGALEPRRRRC